LFVFWHAAEDIIRVYDAVPLRHRR
jgi:hypothetical protein